MNRAASAPSRVLVVDDDQLMLRAFRGLLADEGYQVDSAADGAKALAKYKPNKYILIITDFLMPEMDGLELAEAIKNRSPRQPIMLVTGFVERLTEEDHRSPQFDLLLGKPFTRRDLHEALNRLLPANPKQMVLEGLKAKKAETIVATSVKRPTRNN